LLLPLSVIFPPLAILGIICLADIIIVPQLVVVAGEGEAAAALRDVLIVIRLTTRLSSVGDFTASLLGLIRLHLQGNHLSLSLQIASLSLNLSMIQ
jgi:hypothetical protein